MQTSSSAFRSFSKNKLYPESSNKRKYERVVSYVANSQHLATMLMMNGENRYFHPIKESFVNLSQTDSRISSLQHEFKPKVMNKIKLGELTPFTQNYPSTFDHHFNQKQQQKAPKVVQYYNLKSLILPDENKCIPSIASPQLPPKKPSPINVTSSKSLNVDKQETKKIKKPKSKIILNSSKKEHVRYNREGSKKLVEDWLESIRPFYQNKLISHEVGAPPVDLNKNYFNPWPRLVQKTHQHPLPKSSPFSQFRGTEYGFEVARPIFEPFGIYNRCNRIAYFNNFGCMNYFPFLYRNF
jgi:hypothetical protein